jgi:hypothetical protein
MQSGKFRIVTTLFVMSACFTLAQTSFASDTGVEGVIAISPVPPRMTREGVSAPEPLMSAPFVVANRNGVCASFTTDQLGRFRVSVGAAGHYTISQKDHKSQIRRCGPWEVDVVAGQMTKVEWYCETGGVQPYRSKVLPLDSI